MPTFEDVSRVEDSICETLLLTVVVGTVSVNSVALASSRVTIFDGSLMMVVLLASAFGVAATIFTTEYVSTGTVVSSLSSLFFFFVFDRADESSSELGFIDSGKCWAAAELMKENDGILFSSELSSKAKIKRTTSRYSIFHEVLI